MNFAPPWFIDWTLLGVDADGEPLHRPTLINDVLACHCFEEGCQLDRTLYRARVVGFIQAVQIRHRGDMRSVLIEEESTVETNYWSPDGYRYGVMFDDGSVADHWNGSTQCERAQEYAVETVAWLQDRLGHPPQDKITLARMAPGEPWVRLDAEV